MSDINVDKDVPVPNIEQRSRVRYPFADMGVNDSFTVPRHKQGSVWTAANQFAKKQKPQWKFTTRLEGDASVRVWRVE